MLAPQSDDEIRPFIEELQKLDPLLDIRWDPQSVILAKGSYSEMGKLIPPTYDGRWKVIRYDSPEQGHAGLHPELGYTVIVTVAEYELHDDILCIVRDGAYAPIDGRLIQLMRSADGSNTELMKSIREKLWRQHDAAEARESAVDEGAAREGIDRAHFKANYAGGVGNWQGKGFDFSQPGTTSGAVSRILGASH